MDAHRVSQSDAVEHPSGTYDMHCKLNTLIQTQLALLGCHGICRCDRHHHTSSHGAGTLNLLQIQVVFCLFLPVFS